MIMFTPRLTRPEKGNKYYITKGNGGYSPAIKGKPTDAQCDVLANCFSGDTKIITRSGVVRLDSIEGQDVYVLSKDGKYRLAHGCYFGMQHMYKVIMNNGDEFICTGNHRWIVHKVSKWYGRKYEKDVFKTTLDLCGNDYIPYAKIEDVSMDEDAIRHGFIYGDGSYYNEYRQSRANLCGLKREYMMEFFAVAKHICEQRDGTITCYPYPKEYKRVPEIEGSTLSYLRGFIAGLIASDGCVDRFGCI
jgi:intein/homing endonuclease